MSIIVVGSGKGGVAKSRVSTHIAALAASAGADVVLLDTDVLQNSATSWVRIRDEDGIKPSVPVMGLQQNAATVLASLSDKYDLIVVDIGAQNYRTLLECALLSDMVLVPCGGDQQEIEATEIVLKTLDEMGPRHEKGKVPANVVLTRVSHVKNSKSNRDLRDYFTSLGAQVMDTQLAYRTAWLNTGKTGRTVGELTGKDFSQAAADEMQALYDEILTKINA